jgi:hypothetical protein
LGEVAEVELGKSLDSILGLLALVLREEFGELRAFFKLSRSTPCNEW